MANIKILFSGYIEDIKGEIIMKRRLMASLMIAILSCTFTGCGTQNQGGSTSEAQSGNNGELVFVDWGGSNTDARIEANVKPFEEEYGIKVTVVTPSDYAKLISMVENGTTEWDVMNCDAYWGVYAGQEGYLEPMDYDVIKTKIDEEVQLEHVMGAEIYSSNIAWNTDKYSEGNEPKTWADFFDTSKYPGKRAMWQYPVTVLEAALLADGVKIDELYPLDVDRAFKKLDTIKDDIVWWTKGAQPSQMLASGEADIALAWSGRIMNAKEEGSPIDTHYNQALKISAGWVVPKDAPNKDNAMKFIEFISGAKQQYEFSSRIPYGSTNPAAVELMDDTLKESLGQLESQLSTQTYIDNEYWAANLNEIEEKFNEWLLK